LAIDGQVRKRSRLVAGCDDDAVGGDRSRPVLAGHGEFFGAGERSRAGNDLDLAVRLSIVI